MTLTEYLQNAVTELRERAEYLGYEPDQTALYAALADYVEAMLGLHVYGRCPCRRCDRYYGCTGCHTALAEKPYSPRDQTDCHSLRSVATLVAAVTGRPLPEQP